MSTWHYCLASEQKCRALSLIKDKVSMITVHAFLSGVLDWVPFPVWFFSTSSLWHKHGYNTWTSDKNFSKWAGVKISTSAIAVNLSFPTWHYKWNLCNAVGLTNTVLRWFLKLRYSGATRYTVRLGSWPDMAQAPQEGSVLKANSLSWMIKEYSPSIIYKKSFTYRENLYKV